MVEIRNAQFEDAANLVAIYAHMLKTAITFETQVLTVEDFENRIKNNENIPLSGRNRRRTDSGICLRIDLLCSCSL